MEAEIKTRIKRGRRTDVKRRRKSIFGMLKGKIFCDDAIFNLGLRGA